MEPRYINRAATSHPLLHRRDAPAFEGGTDRCLYSGNLEAIPKMGRNPDRYHPECQRPFEQPRVENIFENSDFVYMLNQAGGDRQILAKQLGISTHQLSYVDPLR